VDVDDDRLTVPEVARRLGIDGGDVYRKIFAGEIEAAPGDDGAVYVTLDALDAYRRAAGPAPSR
jgi:hypothetical protein